MMDWVRLTISAVPPLTLSIGASVATFFLVYGVLTARTARVERYASSSAERERNRLPDRERRAAGKITDVRTAD
jgi:hypothetical protein